VKKVLSVILFSLISAITFIVPAQQSQYAFPFRNPSLQLEERVNDLISRMTLREKADQLLYTAPAIPRLSIPAYNWWNEALHGVARAGYATGQRFQA
jgi:beta-glucosidase